MFVAIVIFLVIVAIFTVIFLVVISLFHILVLKLLINASILITHAMHFSVFYFCNRLVVICSINVIQVLQTESIILCLLIFKARHQLTLIDSDVYVIYAVSFLKLIQPYQVRILKSQSRLRQLDLALPLRDLAICLMIP